MVFMFTFSLSPMPCRKTLNVHSFQILSLFPMQIHHSIFPFHLFSRVTLRCIQPPTNVYIHIIFFTLSGHPGCFEHRAAWKPWRLQLSRHHRLQPSTSSKVPLIFSKQLQTSWREYFPRKLNLKIFFLQVQESDQAWCHKHQHLNRGKNTF